MTLVVALCTRDNDHRGLLISSDSQATLGPVTYGMHKITPIAVERSPLALSSGTGDVALIKKAAILSQKILIWNCLNQWNGNTPSFEQFENAIDEIERALIQKISRYSHQGLNANFDFLLGSVDPSGDASLYVFDHRGVAHPVHDDPGFASIGSGFYLGGNLLLQLFYSYDLDPDQAGDLAAFVINQVSMVDASVGPFKGESWFFRIQDGEVKLGQLKRFGFRQMDSEYNRRRKMLEYIWRQCEIFGAKELQGIITKAIARSIKGKRTQVEKKKKSK